MKSQERRRGLYRAPLLLHQILVRGQYDFIYDQMPIRVRNMSCEQRINLARSGLNFLFRRLKPWSYPLHMQFELVNYCQLRCPVCPTGTGELERKPQAMDPALFRQVMQEAGSRLLTLSLWGWGEPLLHPSLGEILREARRYNAAILVSTNGQNLDRREVVEALIENPPTFLIVALDGLTDESNARFRIGARLEPALQGMELLAKERARRKQQFPILHMRFMAMKHNQHELAETETFARSHGFDMLSIRLLCMIDSEVGLRNQSDLAIDLLGHKTFTQKEMESAGRKNYVCMQPFWFPSLFADGTLVACEQDFNARMPLGVIGTGTRFEDLWFGQRAMQARKKIRDDFRSVSFCRNCPATARDRTDSSICATWLRPGIQRPIVAGG
ncbi:MAG: radical SAM protein [Acidobacteriota bacterium]|nr:radical SAM protein [Acidobacteriota bacterium]